LVRERRNYQQGDTNPEENGERDKFIGENLGD
jgi:hypothetical protein